MDGRRLPKARQRLARRGLGVVAHKNGYLYIEGTLRIADRSVRTRKSTGLHKDTPGAKAAAEEIRIKLESEIKDEFIRGVRPAPGFYEAAKRYLNEVRPGAAQRRALAELNDRFKAEQLGKIEPLAIDDFYRRRFRSAKPATVKRHQAALIALYNFAGVQVPDFARARPKATPGQHMDKIFRPGEAELIVEQAAPHARPAFATLLVTGARVGMTLWLRREHFILAEGRGRVFFPKTKNGQAYDRPLADYAVRELRAWLACRRDDYPEMFLSDKARPYAAREARGGQLEAAFNGAKARAAARLEAEGRPERARVIRRATPHWFRHNFANRLRREYNWDAKRIAEAGMWESARTVELYYIGDESDLVEAGVRGLEFGKKLTKSAARK